MSSTEQHSVIVPPELAGKRLDQALAILFPRYSRSRIKEWINTGHVQVDNERSKPRFRLMGGERIELAVAEEAVSELEPQPIPLDVVHEDAALLVINKPPGLVVHPGAGNPDGTLQNALLHHDPKLARVPRSGIVHRIDKDTSGLLVVARTLAAHASLVKQLEKKTVKREYEAICVGVMTAGGTIDAPIARHPVDRVRKSVQRKGRPAVTHYRVNERFRGHTHVRVMLETGRTHQIRVHLAHAGFPLVGDPLYGKRLVLPKGLGDEAAAALRAFKRQALHAVALTLVHPEDGRSMAWRVAPPEDFQHLVEALRADARAS